ncbi:hypothetical protein HK098_002575 [Nowakowskiella sp. JEL0407]|nr:hypothetical protein HK098_002575 [Nowakowskiella sp. JEL0407]
MQFLAAEIILEIISYFPQSSPNIHPPRNLARTCKHLYHVISPRLYSSFVPHRDLTLDYGKFREYVNNNPTWLSKMNQYVREYCVTISPTVMNFTFPKLISLQLYIIPSELRSVECIYDFGRSCRNLKMLKISGLYFETESLRVLGQSLVNLHLDELDITFHKRYKQTTQLLETFIAGVAHSAFLKSFTLSTEGSMDWFKGRWNLLFDILRSIKTLKCLIFNASIEMNDAVILSLEKLIDTLPLSNFQFPRSIIPASVLRALRKSESLQILDAYTTINNVSAIFGSANPFPKLLVLDCKYVEVVDCGFPVGFKGVEKITLHVGSFELAVRFIQALMESKTLNALHCTFKHSRDIQWKKSAYNSFFELVEKCKSLRKLRLDLCEFDADRFDELFRIIQSNKSITFLIVSGVEKSLSHIIAMLEKNTCLEVLSVEGGRINHIISPMIQAKDRNKHSAIKLFGFEDLMEVNFNGERQYLRLRRFGSFEQFQCPHLLSCLEHILSCWENGEIVVDRIDLDGLSRSNFNRFVGMFEEKFVNGIKIGYIKGKLFIDGKSVKIEQGAALIQACEKAGASIPRFCYHERLAVAGNCRMCLVELEKAPKPVASCAMPAAPGMKVKTNTPLVQKAREGVMEFLLANHPLDCPICDQGGECDLQDQSVRFGSDRSRLKEGHKRAVEDKNLGPLVKTVMTRCIQCTRCVRFANEVAGAVELGTSGRGNDMQIGTYVDKVLNTEMSGNVIDLCPVGALTSKPYAFTSRPWELKKTESIDVLDAIGSNIRIDTRGVEVMRVVPRLNEEVNEEWIADKTRFAYDGLKRQRLTVPLIREGNKFVEATWEDAFSKIASEIAKVSKGGIQAIAGQLADAESLTLLKDLVNALGSESLTLESSLKGLPSGFSDFRTNYVTNSTIAGIDEADALLLIGTNPRHEAPILNTRIRKAYLNGLNVGHLGAPTELNYEYDFLGEDVKSLKDFIDGSHPFKHTLQSAKKPIIIVGSAVLERSDAAAVLGEVTRLAKLLKSTLLTPEWNGLNVLQRAASWTAALDIGYSAQPVSSTSPQFLYLLNADDFDPSVIPKSAFVVYQGHHGDNGAQYADVVLPGAAYTEKAATYVNTEGRTQTTRASVPPPGNARDDWKILRALSEVVGVTLPYNDIHDVRARMAEIAPNLVAYDVVEKNGFVETAWKQVESVSKNVSASGEKFWNPINDYYMTDPISRASVTMAKCSKVYVKKEALDKEFTGPATIAV